MLANCCLLTHSKSESIVPDLADWLPFGTQVPGTASAPVWVCCAPSSAQPRRTLAAERNAKVMCDEDEEKPPRNLHSSRARNFFEGSGCHGMVQVHCTHSIPMEMLLPSLLSPPHLPTTPSARRHHPPALQNKIQVQTIEAGCLLTRNGRRLSGWAKSALEADPNIVLTLSSLSTDVSALQKVCAVTLVVPHTCGTKSEPRALDCEVKATDDETQSCSTVPSSASAMFPSARKGMTGPQIAAVLASKFDQGGKRCATPPLSRSPRGAHDIPRYFLERLLAQPLNQHISVTTSSCTRGYPRGATHPIRHLRVVSDGKAPSVMSVGSLERGGGKWPMHSRAGCSLRV